MIAHRTALLQALLAIVIFATVASSVDKIGLNAAALGIARLVLASAGMTAILAAKRAKRGALVADFRRAWPGLAAMGVLFGLHWLTYFIAIKLGNPSMADLGLSTYGAQLPLLGWACGFGRPKASTVAGIGLALVGSCVCLHGVDLHSGHAGSLAVGVLSGTLYAALPLLHQRFASTDVQLRTWAQFAFALPLFLVLSPWAQWSWTTSDVLIVLHLGLIVTLIGHYLWVQATTAMPIQLTAVVAYMQLPASLAANYLLAGVSLSGGMALGAAMIVGANALAFGARRTDKAEIAE